MKTFGFLEVCDHKAKKQLPFANTKTAGDQLRFNHENLEATNCEMKTFWFIKGFSHTSKQRNGCHLLTQSDQVIIFCLWTSHKKLTHTHTHTRTYTHTHTHTHAHIHTHSGLHPTPTLRWHAEGGQACCHYRSPSVVLQTRRRKSKKHKAVAWPSSLPLLVSQCSAANYQWWELPQV